MEAGAASGHTHILREHRERIGAAIVAAAAIILVAERPQSTLLLVLAVPLVIGCVPPIAASDALSAWIDRWNAGFGWIRDRGTAGGALRRYFLRPLGAGSSVLWRRTEPLRSQHLRAGVRVLVIACFWAAMLAALVATVYVIVAVLVAILFLVAGFWALAHMLGGGPPDLSFRRRSVSSSLGDDDVMERAGVRGQNLYAGTNWFNEELRGRVDQDGNIYRGTNWLNEERIGRVDAEGNIYKGTTWLDEEKVGRVSSDGTLYKGSNWLSEQKTGRIDEDGGIHEGTTWFDEQKRGRTGP